MARLHDISRKHLNSALLAIVILVLFITSQAQSQYNFNYNLALSTPTFSTNEPVEMGFINVANGNLHIEIPIASFPQRGSLSYNARLVYDSRIWQVVSGSSQSWQPTNVPNSMGGWRFVTGGEPGGVTESSASHLCDDMKNTETIYAGFTWIDPVGNKHMFNVSTYRDKTDCDMGDTPTADGPAYDSSGYHIYLTNYTSAKVYAPDGTEVYPQVQDSNGNYFSLDGNGNIVDTQGRAPVTVTSGSNSVTYAAVSPVGRSNYTAATASQSYNTAFHQPGVTEASGALTAITSLTLPDGSSYSFTYDSYAELASMTLPTGGAIQFGYTNFQDAFGNINRWASSRVSGGGTWQYTPAVVQTCTSSNCLQKVTATRPDGGTATYNFFLNNGAWTSSVQYTSSNSQNVTIQSSYSCNASCGPTSNIVKQTQTTALSPYPIVSGRDITKSVQYTYSDPTNGLLGEVDETDFGSPGSGVAGPVLRKMLTTYASLAGNNMINKPYQVTVQNGAGAQVAQTTYTYDGSPVFGTSGTPNHTSVSVARGNPTTIGRWTAARTLNTTLSYFDTGLVYTLSDPNTTITTYGYTCGNSYLGSVSVPGDGATLLTQYVVNCNGGVVTSVTDPNGSVTSTTYNDPYFWRPASSTDPMWNTTYFNYYHVSNSGSSAVTSVGQTESVMVFNAGNSTTDLLNTPDTVGRPWIQQKKHGPSSSSWDTVAIAYDYSSRISWLTLPCTAAAGATCGTVPATNYNYDSLNRYTFVTDWTGYQAYYSYSSNDVNVKVNTGPDGEKPNKQLEYDGLGRLTSVCDITTLPSNGTCRQANGQNGYAMGYQYDPLGNLTQATANYQALGTGWEQLRTFTYDGLSRMLTETNPETTDSNHPNGTITYSYDSDGTCRTFTGDKVKRVDAAGNVTCYQYDGLHRLTQVTYPSGPNAGSTAAKYFYYDSVTSAPWNGLTLSNPKGHLIGTIAVLNGVWSALNAFGYDAQGETTDYYQDSTNSGGWYHVQQSYDAVGQRVVLQGFLNTGGSTNPFTHYFWYDTYEAEGRQQGLGDGTPGTTYPYPWAGTTYTAAGLPTTLGMPGGTSETFSYDPGSNRLTGWVSSSSVLGKSQTGSLTWNANGTLRTLSVSDQFTPANSQNCTYNYDDLGRVGTNDWNLDNGFTCKDNNQNTIWHEKFEYDGYANLYRKSGNVSFTPTYVYQNGDHTKTNNHILSVPGQTVSYDGMGNMTTDIAGKTYSYDAEGRPVTAGGAQITYDALGRAAEWTVNGTTTQIVYDAESRKFAFMRGQSLVNYFVPLAAGLQAVYDSSAQLKYYRHSDWLGSSWLQLNPDGTLGGDRAYAPYGEPYRETTTADRTFTGQTSDTVTDGSLNGTTELYDFLFRQYSPTQGRWLVPDPAGLAAVDLTNPQTWNRYAYVGNNPLNNVDPLGLRRRQIESVPTVPGAVPWYYKPQDMGDFGSAYSLDGGDISSDLLGSGLLGSSDSTGVCPKGSGNCIYADTGGGNASYYRRDANLMLNCENYNGNAHQTCLWSTNSWVFVADANDQLANLGVGVLGPGTHDRWRNASGAGNTALIATGAVAAIPGAVSAAPAVTPYALRIGSTALTLSRTLFYNPKTWDAVEDMINVITPPSYLPHTWPGFFVCLVQRCARPGQGD